MSLGSRMLLGLLVMLSKLLVLDIERIFPEASIWSIEEILIPLLMWFSMCSSIWTFHEMVSKLFVLNEYTFLWDSIFCKYLEETLISSGTVWICSSLYSWFPRYSGVNICSYSGELILSWKGFEILGKCLRDSNYTQWLLVCKLKHQKLWN